MTVTIKYAKPAKPSTRKIFTLRNINASKELSAKMDDLDNSLAWVLVRYLCAHGGGAVGVRLMRTVGYLRTLIGSLSNLRYTLA